MATLKDTYAFTNKDNWQEFDSVRSNNGSQSFTASSSYTLTQIKFMVFRTGATTGTVTVSLYNTDANGLPTGSALSAGTIATSGLYTYDGNKAHAWYTSSTVTVTMSNSVSIVSGTKYAIVLKNSVSNEWIYILSDTTTPSYTGGNALDLLSGTWTNSTSIDNCFEVWGDGAVSSSILNVNGVPLASISNVNGTAIASILNVSGVTK